MSEAVNLVIELTDKGTRKRDYQHVVKCIMLNFQLTIKSKTVVAQKTTTRQSQITVKQQYCWYCTYENALNELLKRNTGLCKLSKAEFKEVIHYFISGGDETCFMAYPDGNVKVIGFKKRRSMRSRQTIIVQASQCTAPVVYLERRDLPFFF